jgi:hypothetical protein
MQFKYTGPDEEITLREVTFKAGKAVLVEDEGFQAKLSNLDYFKEVKPRGRPSAKNKS